MKFYAIYKIRRKDESLIELPSLFAFTNDKELFEEFEEQRDMSMFYVKRKEIDKKLYEKFLKENKAYELSYQDLYTKNQFDLTKKTKVKILSTWKEVESTILNTDIIFKELTKYIFPSVYTFNDKYLETLKILGFMDVCKFVCGSFSENTSVFFDGLRTNCDEYDEWDRIDYCDPDIDYDEFALFMYFNGYTFK